MDGEVLGVAISGGHQDERELCEQEDRCVVSVCAALQQLQALLHAGAAMLLVLPGRPDAEGLTEVLLGQSGDPCPVVHPFAVEALDDQDSLASEGRQ